METQKAYAEYMEEFNPQEIYEGLLRGLFPEKLPPVFTMENFLQYVNAIHLSDASLSDKAEWCLYARYENMRNLNRPRLMGIANPFGYERLCRCIKNCWSELKRHFREATIDQAHKVSRLHVRKMEGSSLIFKMNYHAKAWNQDPVPDLRIGARYLVRSDISSCFPTIYTHSLPWALVGKEESKRNIRNHGLWYNMLDSYATGIRYGETTGLMIGNHASNVLSEIVLCKIDQALCKKNNHYRYVRNIDDYECYADTREYAEEFLVDLKDELAKYNLRINYEKTKIVELPTENDGSWVRKLNAQIAILPDGILPKKNIEAFLNALVAILCETHNAAVVFYAMKALCKRVMNEEARLYYLKYMAHLAALYPYLYGCFDKYLFAPFDVRFDAIASMAERMTKHAFEVRNYEEASFALYFALKYGFDIKEVTFDRVKGAGDAILCVMAWLYSRKRGLVDLERKLVSYAKGFVADDVQFQEQWIFAYEALEANDLNGDWKKIKEARVSFVKDLDEMLPNCTPEHEAERIDWGVSLDIKPEDSSLQMFLQRYYEDLPSHYDRDSATKYLNRVVANLWQKSLSRKNVKIPKDRAKYFFNETLPLGEFDVNIRLLNHVLKWLRANHYIGQRVGIRGEEISRYWPRERLLKLLTDLPVSRIKIIGSGVDSVVVLKDMIKNLIPHPDLSEKAVRYKMLLERINALYRDHKFSCVLAGRMTADRFFPCLKAVFNNSSWDEGGRLYASDSLNGIDYQCIPSDMRPRILIDDKKTVELDYSGLHVNMLYADEGIQLTRDAYDFLPSNQRALAKFAMLVVLNASNEEQAKKALQARRDELLYATGLSPKKDALRRAFILNSDLDDVIEKVKNAHPRISEQFFSQYALTLQNRDSAMALDIVSHFLERSIPVLPIHDSFIIDGVYEEELREEMDKVYGEMNSHMSCDIKRAVSA